MQNLSMFRKEIAFGAIRHLRPVRPDDASDEVRAVYDRSIREFILAPPITLHAVLPDLLKAVWCATRETLIVGAGSRAVREVVAAGVSKSNSCPYCEDAHASMAAAAGATGAVRRILAGPSADDQDEMSRVLAWAMATGQQQTANPGPFDSSERAAMRGTAVVFHYINRVVNVFCESSPMPLAPPSILRRFALGFLTWMMRDQVRFRGRTADSLDLLPAAELPAAFAWAREDAGVAGGLGRLNAVVESLGESYLAAPVRELLDQEIAHWRGEARGLGRGWVEESVAGLDEALRPAGRLVLLAAFASFQIDDSIIDDFRATNPNDPDLLAHVAYGAFVAARRIGSWL